MSNKYKKITKKIDYHYSKISEHRNDLIWELIQKVFEGNLDEEEAFDIYILTL